VRLVVATCTATYSGRLDAHLPLARRLLVVKADGSVLLHADGGSYKPLNWMGPPCTLAVSAPSDEAAAAGVTQVWTVQHARSDDRLVVELYDVAHDSWHDLGADPGLVKDGVEAHLQALLAQQIELLGRGHTLVRREYPTAIGPVDLLARDPGDLFRHVAVEIKRRATIDAVEQLTRYLDLLNRDPLLAPVRGVLAAQSFAPQARVLAADRGIEVLPLDYGAMRGVDDATTRLF
jgi:RecB family endonuclease NucS